MQNFYKSKSISPRIIAFACRWCTYSGADLAGLNRLSYPSNTRIILVPCSGRIDIKFVLRAFAQGADGVIVSSCHPGDCHYREGNYRARRRWIILLDLMETLGLDRRRLKVAYVSAAEGHKWAQLVKDFTDDITKLNRASEWQKLDISSNIPENCNTTLFIDNGFKAGIFPLSENLLSDIKSAWNEGKFTKLFAWKTRTTLARPFACCLKSLEELSQAIIPATNFNIARSLLDHRSDIDANIGIIARPHEIRTLNVLVQECAIDPGNITVFSLDDSGKYLGQYVLKDICIDPKSLRGDIPGCDDSICKRLDELMHLSLDERFSFWLNASERCMRCYACRQSCPLCHCERCYVEQNQPQWFPTASDRLGSFSWLLERAFHLAGRCTGCGACQEACPNDVPLDLLNAAMAKSVWNNFHYISGTDPQVSPLQADYSSDDPDDFIV